MCISSAARPPMETASSPRSTVRDCGGLCPSSGSANCVLPPVSPAGMMDMCSTVRKPGIPEALSAARTASFTTAWPASCAAVSANSCCDCRCPDGTPSSALLYAACTCRSLTPCAPSRAAAMAASLMSPARSAPEKPGVLFAQEAQSMGVPGEWAEPRLCPVKRKLLGDSSARRLACVLRIWTRPCTSGRGTFTWRSNLPGRSRALSRMSARFVVPITTTPSTELNPSISARSCVSAAERSVSRPPPRSSPLRRPM
mmetsp:Transcript_61239/g.163859  ORF Transcript_61239/g.163859 Transcript_61239/m.163859 type:complete len:256 (-) Transcript_61239:48-815(-)